MTDFATLSLSTLVRSYNTVAAALGETEVRKFSDKPGAVKRLHNIIVRALEAGALVNYAEDGSVRQVTMLNSSGDSALVPDTINDGVNSADEPALQTRVQMLGGYGPTVGVETPETAPAAKLATTLDLTAKIKILVANPKRAGSRAHAVFALYADGQTGQQFVEAVVAAGHPVRVALTNLHWDLDHGFIYLGE